MSLRLERIILMSEEINRGRFPSVQDLCHKFEIQERTFYEDLRFIREFLGLEIRHSKAKGGYYNADPSKKLPEFNLSHGEVFALTLGKEMLSQYVGTSFEPILTSAIEKIIKRLPDRVKVNADDIKCLVKFHPGAVIPVERKLFLDLNRACEKQRPVAIRYFSASKGETTDRVVEPLRLLENRATWYLVAYCRLRRDLRYFALHRIEKYDVLEEEVFGPREDLTIDEWIDQAFQLEHTGQEHSVKVKFQPKAARYIRERQWHQTQKLTEHEDGSCTLEFVTQSLDEAKRWVLTYGSDAMVLEPSELQSMIAEEHRKAAEQSARISAGVR
jgi:predicted DNA-binding transcriptional regulator YafY